MFGSSSPFGASSASPFGVPAAANPVGANSNPFGSNAQGNNPFGAKPFGSTSPAFGAQTSSSLFGSGTSTGVFGAPATPAFGAASTTPAFGGPNPASAQPAAGGIFSQHQQPAPAAASPFGSGSTAFGAAATPNPFGSTSTPNPFGAKPAFGSPSTPTPVFGQSSTPAFGTSTFGLSGSAFGGANAAAFGAASAPAFGQANSTPAFGSSPSPFGQSSGGAFGSSTFGASAPSLFGQSSPAFGAASTPAFGGGASAPAFGGQTSSAFGGGGLFGNSQAASSGGLFGASTPGSQPFGSSPAPSFGSTLFSNTSTPGSLFGQTKPAGLTQSSSSPLFSGFGATSAGQPPSAVSFPNLQTPQQGTTNVFGAAPSSFGQPNAFGLQQPTQNVVSVPSTPVTNPFGTLPAMPQITIGRSAGSGASVLYGISSMLVSEKPTQVRVNTLLTPRHITQRSKVRMHARRYHPKKDSPKVSFFSDGDDAPSTPKAGVVSILSSSYAHYSASFFSLPSYSYRALDSERNEIRLIKLQDPITSETLHGDIIHVPLVAELRYWALSYCWGSLAKKETIILDGKKLQITINLNDALRQLGNSYGMLWVDAICINQEDIPEKSREVLRMGEIYSGACGVVIWLGVASKTSDRAMDFLQVLETKAPRSQYDEYLKDLPSLNGLGKFGDEWIALKDLAKNGYWSRTWIIQELALCRRSKIVHCGTKSLPWDYFENFFGLRRFISGKIAYVALGSPDCAEVVAGVMSLQVLSNSYSLELGDASVVDLLYITTSFLATDPRDRLYGMLALNAKLRQLVPHPNYANSVGVVFRDLTKAMLANGYNLDLICLKTSTHVNRSDVESWVPDWDVRGPCVHSPDFLLQAIRGNHSRSIYFADAGKDAVISYVGHGSVLRVRGISYDKVDGLGLTETADLHLGTNEGRWKRYDVVEPDRRQNAYGSDVDTIRALKQLSQEIFRVWNSGVVHLGCSLNNEYLIPRVYRQIAFMDPNSIETQSSLDWLRRTEVFNFAGRSLQQWYEMAYTHGQALPLASSVVQRDPELDGMLNCLDHVKIDQWRWFSTDRGYLGRTHAQTQKGDEIVIVQGCSVPVVLRPCGPYYIVVCAAYVQGIMNGEALQGVTDGEMRYFDLT